MGERPQPAIDDELYQVPPDEFIAARDRIASRLTAAGDETAAAEVRRARKPNLPAWAANQVVWRAAPEWQRLKTTARMLRNKHETAAPAEELREAGRAQREALAACEARAAELLAQHGHVAEPAVLQKVGGTLLALAYGAPGVTPGRLERELPPPGFEAFAGLTLTRPEPRGVSRAHAAAPAPAPSRPLPATEKPVRDARHSERAESERAARAEAETKAEQERARRAALAAAEARHAEARRALLKARARLDSEEDRRAKIARELEAARHACEDARRALEAAEADAAEAETAVQRLRSGSR